MFVGAHVALSGALNVPELAMDMEEGDRFFKAAQNVMRHYSVDTTQKTVDWIAFAGVVATIYGSRFGAFMVRKRMEAEPRTAAFRAPTSQRSHMNGTGKVAETPVQPAPNFSPSAEPDFSEE